jgi:hypothetical protein
MRAVFVDPVIVVQDGYNRYAELMTILLQDWSFEIGQEIRSVNILIENWSHKLRIGYSLVIAEINLVTSVDVIIIGKAISLISFLASIYLFNLVLIQSGFFNNLWKKNAVLSLYITNSTVMINLVRFETDVFFLALILAVIVLYQQFRQRGRLAKLATFVVLMFLSFFLVFTREIGIFLIGALVIHQFIVMGKKGKGVFVFFILILGYLILIDEYLRQLIFFMFWSGGTFVIAEEVINNGNFIVLFEYLYLKFTAPNLYTKNFEAIAYAFGISFFVGIFSFGHIFRDKIRRRKVLSNVLTVYFLLFLFSYFLLKIGRGLDRFFLPIIFIPYMLAPAGIERIAGIIENRGLAESPNALIQAKILAGLVVCQIIIFGIRLIMALLEIGIEF